MGSRRGGNRYPRPGDRLAPTTLQEVLLEPVPRRLVDAADAAGLRLCDLDESVWDKLEPDVIAELGEIILDRVAAGYSRGAFQQRHFPRPPEGMKLEDLRLEHRTRLCLAREGLDEDPTALGRLTLGEILSIRAFGPRCLVDLLSAMETLLAQDDRLCPELTAEAVRLAALSESATVFSDDPRFRSLMYEVDVEARSAKELADRLVSRTQDGPDPAFAAATVRELRERIEGLSHLTLEEELIQIFASTEHERNREILIGYYGWKDGRQHTLAEIGAQYGMTRERTRQICAKLVKRNHPETILAPVLDRVLAFLAERLPCPAARLERELIEAGCTAVGMGLEGIAVAAKLLAREKPFQTVRMKQDKMAVPPDQVDVPVAVVEAAKKEVYYHGLATVKRIEEALASRCPGGVDAELVVEVIQMIDGFSWLDRKRGWFRLVSVSKHGLPKVIEKVLAVAGPIRVADLRAAVGRNHRMWKVPPPKRVLLEFCRQTPGVEVEGDRIAAEPAGDWKTALTGVEKELVSILKEHGPVMERGAFEDLCVGRGMNRFSFHAFIASSPVITQYGHSVYGLLGADVEARTVQSLIRRRRTDRTPKRVLDRHGQTEDGRLWLSYRLSKAASTYAVITVPSAIKDVVSGRFQLVTPEGDDVGTLAAKDGRAWGLGAYLRRQGAQVDDHVVITVDVPRRTAVISMNGDVPDGGKPKAESGEA